MSTIAAPRHTGLVPALAGLFSAVTKPAASINLDRIAIGLVFLAGVVAILKKNGAEVPQYMLIFGCALGFAGLLYEMSASRSMMRAWWNANPFALFVNGVIWCAAFSFSIFNWIGAAAEGQAQKTNIQKAAFMHSADARTGLDMARDALAKARKAAEEKHNAAWETIPVVAGQKITDRAQAQAVLDGIKAQTRLWDYTEQCTKTDGPKTRAFCKDFADAKASLAWADTHPALIEAANDADKDVSRLEAELQHASSVASNTAVVTSEDRADLFMLTDWGGMSESRAQQLTGLISVLVISIFISFGSMRDEAAQLALSGNRRRWSFFSRAYRSIYRKLWGHEPDNTTYVTNYLDPRGEEALRKTHALRGQMSSSAAQALEKLQKYRPDSHDQGAFA